MTWESSDQHPPRTKLDFKGNSPFKKCNKIITNSSEELMTNRAENTTYFHAIGALTLLVNNFEYCESNIIDRSISYIIIKSN